MTDNKSCKVIVVNKEKIVLTIDEPATKECIGEILLTPAFGVAAKRMFPLSYFLTQNGFRVFRMDFRDHVGASTGDISNASLSKQVEDILTVAAETRIQIIVSLSLSARAAMRACALYDHILHGVFIAPVVDVKHTLHMVSGEDLFEAVLAGLQETDILGYNVKDTFVKNCIKSKFETWKDTVEDLSTIKGSLTFISGDSDPWVLYKQVENTIERTAENGKEVKLLTINAASHKIDRNPKVASAYFETATRECLKIVGKNSELITIPNFRDIIKAANYN